MTTPVFFRSGSSNRADFAAVVKANVPAGLVVDQVSRPVWKAVESYLQDGGQVFIDSGAFGAFRKGTRLERNDFKRILAAYAKIAVHATPGRLHVGAPDVIADQEATLGLIRDFSGEISQLAALGVEVLVPLQKGRRSIAEFYREIAAVLGVTPFRAALPSNAAALTADEALAFLREIRPASVHFLGAARSRRFQELLAGARDLLPGTAFAYDAAVIRSVSCQIVATPAKVNEMAAEMLDGRDIDEGELACAMRDGDEGTLRVLAETLAGPGRSAEFVLSELQITRMTTGDYMEAVEKVEPALDALWPYSVMRWARSEARRLWRTNALAAHPSFRDDPVAVSYTPSLFAA